jgi:ribosomal protein L32E
MLDESDMVDHYEESSYETFVITSEEEYEPVDVRNKAKAIAGNIEFIAFKDLIKASLTDLEDFKPSLKKGGS